MKSLPAESDIDRVTQRIDKIADFELATEQFATIAADLAVTPDAIGIKDDIVPKSFPQRLMIVA